MKNSADVFWLKVLKTGHCWLWQGGKDKDGYGKFHFCGRHWRSHRLAWLLTRGSLTDDLVVCHTCDTPACVRPDHLFIGTVVDNVNDCVQKGRRKGVRNNKKITADVANTIRMLYATGAYRQKDLGDRFGISQPQVSAIVNRFNGTWT